MGGGEGNSQGCAERKILASPRSSSLWNPDCPEFCHPWANLRKSPSAIGNCCKSTDLIVNSNNNNYCLRVIFCVIQNNQGKGRLITLYQNLDYCKYCGTSPLGHLYSGDTSIQETQNLVLEKCPHNLCICYQYWRDISIQGKAGLWKCTGDWCYRRLLWGFRL